MKKRNLKITVLLLFGLGLFAYSNSDEVLQVGSQIGSLFEFRLSNSPY